jgi:hypothetical protein
MYVSNPASLFFLFCHAQYQVDSHLGVLVGLLVPAVAFACPGSASACGTGCASFGPYMAALGVGLLVGIGSVGLEGFFKRK